MVNQPVPLRGIKYNFDFTPTESGATPRSTTAPTTARRPLFAPITDFGRMTHSAWRRSLQGLETAAEADIIDSFGRRVSVPDRRTREGGLVDPTTTSNDTLGASR